MSRIVGCCVVLLSVLVSVLSQASTTVRGTVTDSTGGIIPGASVTVIHETTDEATTRLTDETGNYAFTGLPPGIYTLTADVPGFEVGTYSNVELAAGQEVLRNFTLEIGAVDTLVVVGSRAGGRTATESTVPVDVIAGKELVSQGITDVSELMRTLTPSFNVNTQPISDAATIVRPANLRNLPPDHTLVLVNGKRRHRAAIIQWLGNGVADGAQGPDLSVIPAIALRQAEVLRDGAAAQYGSDAIAGVMNFQLKDARSGGSVEFRAGAHRDGNYGDSRLYPDAGGHGLAYSFAGNAGLPLGPEGFVNLSIEYGSSNPTNRSVQRNDALALISAGNTYVRDPAQVWGSPLVDDNQRQICH